MLCLNFFTTSSIAKHSCEYNESACSNASLFDWYSIDNVVSSSFSFLISSVSLSIRPVFSLKSFSVCWSFCNAFIASLILFKLSLYLLLRISSSDLFLALSFCCSISISCCFLLLFSSAMCNCACADLHSLSSLTFVSFVLIHSFLSLSTACISYR